MSAPESLVEKWNQTQTGDRGLRLLKEETLAVVADLTARLARAEADFRLEHAMRIEDLEDQAKFQDRAEAAEAQVRTLTAQLAQAQRKLDGYCDRCGEKHPIHTGCSSNWTGVDKNGR